MRYGTPNTMPVKWATWIIHINSSIDLKWIGKSKLYSLLDMGGMNILSIRKQYDYEAKPIFIHILKHIYWAHKRNIILLYYLCIHHLQLFISKCYLLHMHMCFLRSFSIIVVTCCTKILWKFYFILHRNIVFWRWKTFGIIHVINFANACNSCPDTNSRL